MRTLCKLWVLLVCLSGCGKTTEAPIPKTNPEQRQSARKAEDSYDIFQELSSDEARELIPRAASLSKQEYLEILNHPPVRLRGIKNQTLTALLLAVDPFLLAENRKPHADEDFRYLVPNEALLNPQAIHAALMGKPGAAFVSIIQPEYITKCSCQNRGETARGRVDYRAGNVYEGSANFTALRRGEEWQIVAFSVPEYRLVTHRQPNGIWKLDSENLLLGVTRQ